MASVATFVLNNNNKGKLNHKNLRYLTSYPELPKFREGKGSQTVTAREESHARAKALIESAGSCFVSAEFWKKDGSLRKIVFNPRAIEKLRVGEDAEQSHRAGNEVCKVRNPWMYPVVDAMACRYHEARVIRSINLDTLRAIKVLGVRHEFRPVTL